MRFQKLIWPAIWSSLALCVIVLSFSIFCNVFNVPPPMVGSSTTITATDPNSETNTINKGDTNVTETDNIKIAIVMYHGLIKDSKLQNKYFISPSLFENDLKYLNDKGYSTINMTELIDYVYNGTPLPEKPIILTFDDGFYNNYLYAYPALKKYNQKAVISILGSQTDRYSLIKIKNSYYSYLTWNQINEMIMSGHIEIQNHTYDMHTYDNGRKGCSKKSSESMQEYKDSLIGDLGFLQQRITDYTGTTPNTIAYPFGYYTETSEAVIKEMGFNASLTCCQKINEISRNPDCLYTLGRFLRSPEKSSDSYFKDILREK